MRMRAVVGLVLAVVALLAMAASAQAGAWATVEMEKPITRVEVDEEMTLDFRLLQHGVTPIDWTSTYFEATNAETAETFRVDAVAGAEVGDWSVTVVFPSAGTWDWSIQTEELAMTTTFPSIEVVEGSAAVGSMSQKQLDSAITLATEPLEKQISSMAGDLEVMNKQIANLSSDREMLAKQVANLQAMQSEPVASESANWWMPALAGALAAIVVIAGVALLAFRRGLVQTPRLASAPVSSR